jgi:hypothetical protein
MGLIERSPLRANGIGVDIKRNRTPAAKAVVILGAYSMTEVMH